MGLEAEVLTGGDEADDSKDPSEEKNHQRHHGLKEREPPPVDVEEDGRGLQVFCGVRDWIEAGLSGCTEDTARERRGAGLRDGAGDRAEVTARGADVVTGFFVRRAGRIETDGGTDDRTVTATEARGIDARRGASWTTTRGRETPGRAED